jgi:hypothetical protein
MSDQNITNWIRANDKQRGEEVNKITNMMSRKLDNNQKLELNMDIAYLSIDMNITINQITSPTFNLFFSKWFFDFKI